MKDADAVIIMGLLMIIRRYKRRIPLTAANIYYINELGTSTKFIGYYTVGKGIKINENITPVGFPEPEMFSEDVFYYDPQPSDIISDLKDRLIIDWGMGTVSWHQWATNEKAVHAIQSNPKFEFTGYENVILSYNELKEIVSDKTLDQ